mmetsp:Transcript_106730/g.175029  ORF Transcript_106730/g.175029 Transcript_106730/m.175029 type:complete len:771 (+) Transcript_106730:357-2669(+)
MCAVKSIALPQGSAKVSDPLAGFTDPETPATSATEQSPAVRPKRKSLRARRIDLVKERHLAAPGETGPWIQRTQADVFFGMVIMLQGVNMGIEAELCLNSPSGVPSPLADAIILTLEAIFTFIYVIELFLRLRAEGCAYLSWWQPFHIFDTLLVLFAVVDVALGVVKQNSPVKFIASIRVFRLLRLGRIIRLLHLFPELHLLVSGLAKTFRAALWAIVLLLLFCYCGALFCAELLGYSDDEDLKFYFGSVARSLLTHIKFAMVEAWPDIAAPMFKSSGWWRYYVVVFICIANLQLLNVVTGVVCEQVISTGANLPPPKHTHFEQEKKLFRRHMKWQAQLHDAGDRIEDWLALLKTIEVRDILQDQMVCLPLERKVLLFLLDEENKQQLSLEEVMEALMRLKGSQAEHEGLYHALRYDIGRYQRHTFKHVAEFENDVQKHIYKTIDEPGRQLFKQAGNTADTITTLDKLLSDQHMGKALRKEDCETEKLLHADEVALEEGLQSTCSQLQAIMEGFQGTLACATRMVDSPMLQSTQRRSGTRKVSDVATQTAAKSEHMLVNGETQTEESRPAHEVASQRQTTSELGAPALQEVPSEPHPELPLFLKTSRDASPERKAAPEMINISMPSPAVRPTVDVTKKLARPVPRKPSPMRSQHMPSMPSLGMVKPALSPSADFQPNERRSFLNRLAKGQLHEGDIDRLASKAPTLTSVRAMSAASSPAAPRSQLAAHQALASERAGSDGLDPVSLAKRRRCLVKLAGTAGAVAPSSQRS